MPIQCGIVGLPNVGKSTLFNALTKAGIEAANYPFCTIDPNVGVVQVPDPRLQAITDLVNPKKVIQATVEFVDIAGLVAGAAKGEGLGNQFLGHIRETDAIAHVVRCFDDPDITHVAGRIDPLADIEIIDTELVLADLESIEKNLIRVKKTAKSGDKAALLAQQQLEQLRAHCDQGQPVRTYLADHEIDSSLVQQLITAKPVMFIANVLEDGLTDNPLVNQVAQFAQQQQAELVVICASIESELVNLTAEEQQEFLTELNLSEPGLNRVIRAGYDLLGLQTFFTAGEKEVRAWTVKKNAPAPKAAAAIHTDFEKGFIRAEVISYDDFITYQGEAGAKDAGKWRLEGKDYLVQDGDVMHFRFNV